MNGIITIKGLDLYAYVGACEEERKVRQKVLLDVEIFTDITEACETDRIESALDYMPLIEQVKEYVLSQRHNLIERYAKELLLIFMSHERTKGVRLEFKKPDIRSDVDYVSMRVEEWK